MSTWQYLKECNNNCTLDFIHIDSNGCNTVHSNRLINIINAHKLNNETKKAILEDAPFLSNELYNQPIFKQKFDLVIFSLLLDSVSTLYQHKKTGELIALHNYPDFTSKSNEKFYEELYDDYNEFESKSNPWKNGKIKKYRQHFEYLGYMTVEDIIKSLDKLIELLPKTTNWIFIIGNDLKPPENIYYRFKDSYKRRKRQNSLIINHYKNKKNIDFIELSSLISSPEDIVDHIDHYKRHVYYNLSLEISKKMNKLIHIETVQNHNLLINTILYKLKKSLKYIKYNTIINFICLKKHLLEFYKKICIFFIIYLS